MIDHLRGVRYPYNMFNLLQERLLLYLYVASASASDISIYIFKIDNIYQVQIPHSMNKHVYMLQTQGTFHA